MINKIYKTIHNKYSRFFRFIFFLRYLIGLFSISIILFLFIPNFFNLEKRSKFLTEYLANNYDLKISKYENIKYQVFPSPNFEFTNLLIKFESSPVEMNVKKLKIYPKLLSIYNNENFQTNKIVFNKTNAALKTSEINFFIKNFLKQKNKLYFKDLNLKINNESNSLTSIKGIKFRNFGSKKNIIEGNIFSKKFKIKINNNLDNINFQLHKSGVKMDLDLGEKDNENSINGIFRSKILNTNFIADFIYDGKSLKINNSFFRSKNLSFSNNSLVILKPFLDGNLNFEIESINVDIFNELSLEKLLIYKNILKKINTKNEINFNSKKLSRSIINELNLKFDLVYGRLNYSKFFSISDNIFECEGSINLLEEYPSLFFDCFINSNNKRELLKEFGINIKKKDNGPLNINSKGSFNIISRKINFKEISMNENYKASNEDLNYFKNKFENILLKDKFYEILNLKKIKEFILEIS